MNKIINNRYHLKHLLGQGSFGMIYSGIDNQTGNSVAIKLSNHKRHSLQNEALIYKELNNQKVKGVAKLFWFGEHKGATESRDTDVAVMVLERLGSSLQDSFERHNYRISFKKVMNIAVQIIDRIEALHQNNIIHRDIKPSNFLMGTGSKKHLVYLIDFGLSKHYLTENGEHIPHITGKSLVGTAKYASVNVHEGIEASRRDDLISAGYTLIYLLRGNLPWQDVRMSNKRKRNEVIKNMKVQIRLSELCDGLPKIFIKYLKYVQGLAFDEKPNYQKLREFFLG